MKAFFKEYGHRIFTFMVGLAFISAVVFCVGFVAVKIYRVFVPNNIYTSSTYESTLYGGSVYEAQDDSAPEDASAEFFEDYLTNLIRQDMPNFQDPTELNDEYIISFGLWQAIKLNNAQGVYTHDSKGNFRVPASDVEMYAQYCLDYASEIKHRTVDICGEFSYNILNKTYKIRSSGVQDYLVPDVINVEPGENDTYIVTVDCYRSSLISAEDPTNDPKNFYKRVEITLQDMGIQDYTAIGNPVHRYIILEMKRGNDDIEEQKDNTENTEKDE